MFVQPELSQSARNGYAASGPSFTCHATQPSTKSTLYTLCTRVEVVEVQAKKTRKQVVIRPQGTSSGICSDALAKAKVLANVSSVAQRGPKTAASPAVKTFRIYAYAVQPSSVQCIAINIPKIPKSISVSRNTLHENRDQLSMACRAQEWALVTSQQKAVHI